MINKIKSLSNSSKYTMWYCSIIENAANRTKFKGCEKHHIVPKSIWEEGVKLKKNLVLLTAREHFICHRLLVKMLLDSTHKQYMESAFWLMLNNTQVKYTSTTYQLAKQQKSNAMMVMWANKEYRTSMVEKKQWFYNSKEQKEANRQKALAEMQNPETKAKFVKAGLEAGKLVREANVKTWVDKSLHSEQAKANAKKHNQSDANREACSRRELSKTKEERTKLAKQGQQALVEKLGGEEMYKKYLSDRIKGRKRYINPITKQVKITYTQPEGFLLFSDYSKQAKDLNVYF